MVRLVAEGWLLGLSTGPYCLTACLPVMVPYLLSEGAGSLRKNLGLLGQFLLGRGVSYAAFGAFVGWAGWRIKPYVTQEVSRVALGVTALVMLGYVLARRAPQWGLCRRLEGAIAWQRMPLLLGVLVGINVCPPFLVAAARVLQIGGWSNGVLFFAGFFSGTALYTLPLLGMSPFTRQARAQQIGTLSALLVGAWLLLAAICRW